MGLHVLDEVEPSALSLDELDRALDGLEAERRLHEARRRRILGEYDHRDGHARFGATSVANDLAYRHGRSRRALRSEVLNARRLRSLPLLAQALEHGTITGEHADALCRVVTEETIEAAQRDEQKLVRLARRLGVDDYRKALRRWAAHAAPDEASTTAPSEWANAKARDGGLFTKGRFNAEDGATIRRAVDQLLDELHQHGGADDQRPTAQRQAEVIVELFRRGAGLDADLAPSQRTRPQVVVFIDHDDLRSGIGVGQFDTGETLSAMAVRRLACDADVVSAIFGTDSALLDLGRTARLASPAQRIALVLRDGGCVFPNCDRPPGWCDAHHIRHWIDLGPTDLDNLCLLCSKHHHLLHEGGWSLRRAGGGELVFTRPDAGLLPQRERFGGRATEFERLSKPPARRAPAADNEETLAA